MIIDFGNGQPFWGRFVAFDPAQVQAGAGMTQGFAQIWKGNSDRRLMRAEAAATEEAAAIEAAGLRRRATEERAASQREAFERDRATSKVIGTQVALAADSGAGTGGTILDLIDETAERGAIQRGAAMFKGESAARGMEDKADFGTWQAGTRAKSLRQKGDASFTGSIFEGVGKIGEATYKYGKREGWLDGSTADSDDTDPRTGWRTRVYKAKR